jgi:hypothetical protein
MPDRFDARAYWAALDPEQQRQVGEAALLLSMAVDGQTKVVEHNACERWGHAEDEAWHRLEEIAPDPADYPEGPDLAALDIASCRVCGCTDLSACPEGCSWVENDLCSACATAELEPLA